MLILEVETVKMEPEKVYPLKLKYKPWVIRQDKDWLKNRKHEKKE